MGVHAVHRTAVAVVGGILMPRPAVGHSVGIGRVAEAHGILVPSASGSRIRAVDEGLIAVVADRIGIA